MWQKLLNKMKEHAEATGVQEFCDRHSIKLTYRGVELKLQVRGWLEEWILRWASTVKTRLARTASLAILSFEHGFYAAPAALTCDVFPDLVASYAKARESAERLVAGLPLESEVILPLLLRRRGMLLTLDSTFDIEIEAAKMWAGELGMTTMETEILNALPHDRHRPFSAAERHGAKRSAGRCIV